MMAIIASICIFFSAACLTAAVVYTHKHMRNAALSMTLLLGVFAAHGGLAAAMMISPERSTGDHETALAQQKTRQHAEDVLARAVTLRFDKTCTFNGYVVEGEWLRSDLQPCIERGSVRIWRVEQTSKNGTYVHYELGRVNTDGTVSSGFSYTSAGLIDYSHRSGDATLGDMAKLLETAFPLPAKASL